MADFLPELLDQLDDIGPAMADFEALCDLGGRFAGSESEKAAVGFLKRRMAAVTGSPATAIETPYDGWTRVAHSLTRLTPSPETLDCLSLVWSPATPAAGLEAEVVDLGRGELDEFRNHAEEIKGRIVLVRHEYMFTEETLHRRYKYDAAREAGAVGFLIANHLPGEGLLSGSSGRNRPEDIPAMAITAEGAALLGCTSDGFPRVRLSIDAEAAGGVAETLSVEIPSDTNEWLVLSAHIDGHPLGESAMDNATGLAAALAVTEALAPHRAAFRRGLRLMFFNVEEWGLWGSAEYVGGLSPEARQEIALNVNLDSIAGDPNLTAITSGYPALAPFLTGAASAVDVPLAIHDALMRNSDHYNFAVHGIPAFRLVAGFGRPESNLRHVLMAGDTRDKVDPGDMRRAVRLTAAILARALTAERLDFRP